MTDRDDILSDIVSHRSAWIGALTSMSEEEGPLREYWNGVARTLQSASHIAESSALEGVTEAREVFPQLRTALLIKEATAEPATAESNDAGYWRHEIKALDRLTAHVEAKLGLQVTLQDWRAEVDLDEGESLAEPVNVKITTMEEKIDIELDDGRSIWVEIQGNDMRVMSYNQTRDEPMVVKVPVSGDINVDPNDYLDGAILDRDDETPTP